MALRAPVVVGRDHELELIRTTLAKVATGRGQVVFLTGEAGIGKSRLASVATDLAYQSGMSIMRGRGSAMSRTIPFRCLSEALLSLQRLGTTVDIDELGPYRPALARLNPDWGAPAEDASSSSLIVLAEGVLRLMELVGRNGGCAVVIDDLQYADPDTLAVLEYVIDNIAHQPALLLATMRDDDSAALEFARDTSKRDSAVLVELRRFRQQQVSALAGACLEGSLPAPALDLLWAGSGGLPLFVEELLDEIVSDGQLVRTGDVWSMTAAGVPPSALVHSVAGRFGRLSDQAREFVSVAAVIGLRFPLTVVREVTGLDYRTLLRYLQSEPVAHLIGPDDHTPDWYLFTHALVADAVLTLIPEEVQADLARRAADAVEKRYPGVPGDWCHLCATLREAAGQTSEAGSLYAEAGRRALAQGAAQSAVTLLDRSLELVHEPVQRFEALEAQLLALTEAGQVDRALAMSFDSSGLDRAHRARLHTQLAWAANLAGRTSDGLAQVEVARALLGSGAPAEASAPIDVVAAHLELDRSEPGSLDRAESVALRAATVAERVPLPVVACQAWQLLGALTRRRDPAQATAYLERSRAFAIAHDLPIWEIHALVRLGLNDALRDGEIGRLEQARDLASRIGAVIARYQSEVNIGLQLVLRADHAAASLLIDDVSSAAKRLGLQEIGQFMAVLRAVLAGHRGDRTTLTEAWSVLSEPGGEQHTARLYGLAATFCSLLEEDRPRARADLSQALAAERATPTTYHLTGRLGLSLLLRAVDGDLTRAEYEETVADPAAGLRWDHHFALLASAVLAGAAGDAEAARTQVVESADVGMLYPMARHLGLRLVGEAAARDGWGDPEAWLRTAEHYFHDAGIAAVAGACRAQLRQMGVRVTQRRSGTDEVPDELRLAGVTVREYEVMRLLGARLANNEIAAQLHVSPRTVEKHVSSLLTKTGLTNRLALGKLATGRPD
ncbi:AAA family ATPase [Lentzea sp. BCCO 10_0856]|uniref:AAA family ATPase n=1 Tax=Lentzea miocenica TaxID=3095431 RepID=A0ABU4SXD1_9PSEU|nr:AAA family ATPase [Lentzea sp. BCCO 10_0856]MDX8030575.1 AAA family ATPase [Lentzea sp. BCCO 10_0856]